MLRAPHLTASLALALPLLAVACGGYRTQVTRTPGSPTLTPLPQAEVVRAKPPTAGAEVGRIDAQGTGSVNAADCEAYLAREAAKLGAPVVVVDSETTVPAAGPHCSGIAYAPGSPTGQ